MLRCQEKTPPRRKEVASSSEWSNESDEMKPEKSTLILTKWWSLARAVLFVCLKDLFIVERERKSMSGRDRGRENPTQTLH